jgi:hypothetical protein
MCTCNTMLRLLPCDHYAEFVNGLMRTPSLSLATVQASFQTEQAEAQFVASAPWTAPKALAIVADTDKPICLFCGIANHTQECCFKFLNAQKQAKAAVADCKQRNKPNNACKASTDANNTSVSSNSQAMALSASLRLASLSHTKADMFWIADTGATSHMSPHRKWFVEYCPYHIPVHIANDTVVYSAGIGEVVLTPADPSLNPCCLTCVLYVPELQNNLLSVLHLVANHSFHVEIEGKRMSFTQNSSPRFVATIKGTMAYMDMSTESITEAALASCKPLTRSLWH